MVNVCFAGVTGWTAPPIVAAIDAAEDLSLTCGVSRSAAGQPLSAVGSRSDGFVYASVPEALESSDVDVLVDYTSATAVKDDAWSAVQAGIHVVIGSSGLTAGDYDELDRLARDRGVGVIAAGNFSIMAAVLRHAAAIAAQHLVHWEIVDYASAGKADVPSGTSRELAERLGQVRLPKSAVPLADLHGPVEARGVEVAGTRIHSVRLPSFVVTTEIVFAGPGNDWLCGTTRERARSPTLGARCSPSAGSARGRASAEASTHCSSMNRSPTRSAASPRLRHAAPCSQPCAARYAAVEDVSNVALQVVSDLVLPNRPRGWSLGTLGS